MDKSVEEKVEKNLLGDTNGKYFKKHVWDFYNHFTFGNIVRYSIISTQVGNVKKQNKEDHVRILDIGSGYSTLYTFFKRNFAQPGRNKIDYIGLEYVQEQVDWVNENLTTSKVDLVQSVQFDLIKNVPSDVLKDKKFDIIIAQEIIEHIPLAAGEAFLKDVNDNLLADNGVLLLSSPNPKKDKGEDFIFPEDHEYEYSYDEMVSLITKHKLLIKEEFGISGYLNDFKDIEVKKKFQYVSNAFARVVLALDKPKLAQCYLFMCEKGKV